MVVVWSCPAIAARTSKRPLCYHSGILDYTRNSAQGMSCHLLFQTSVTGIINGMLAYAKLLLKLIGKRDPSNPKSMLAQLAHFGPD